MNDNGNFLEDHFGNGQSRPEPEFHNQREETLPMNDSPDSYAISRLHSRHREIARYHVLGVKNRDIAAIMNLHEGTVSRILGLPMVKEEVRWLNGAADADVADVRERIRQLTPEALEVLETLMRDESTEPRLRSSIADKILDRSGHTVDKNININDNTNKIDADYMDVIKDRARRYDEERAQQLALQNGTEDEGNED